MSAAFEMYIERIGKPPAPMLLDYPMLIEARSVWVAERAEEIEGVLVQFETPGGFYIDTVASSPRARGTGIGRALLQFSEREAFRRGYASVYLCPNSKMTENQVFYPSIGYVEYERKRDAGYDRVFYRKRLAWFFWSHAECCLALRSTGRAGTRLRSSQHRSGPLITWSVGRPLFETNAAIVGTRHTRHQLTHRRQQACA